MRAACKASGSRPTVRATLAFVVALSTSCTSAIAGMELLDVDTQFRARIAKEKIRTAAEQRKIDAQEKALDQSSRLGPLDQSNCGSQSIGNFDAGERGSQAAPRELFVFAPNAINIVGQGGCR